ncbi:MAG TPA: GH92 family glycosyl hydrolase [Candidatus Acidoferrales bacterium]|nr:GH92 family glycosyl hydrolase [Candidatus Acidoferrales bacterium]
MLKFIAQGLIVCAAAWTAHSQVDYVDPSIGSVGHLLEPTRPTVSLPNSMVRVYPVRKDGLDDQIHSFPLTIISHRLGELFWLMPCDGEPDAGAWDRPAAYDQEKETPYYYSTRLDGSWIQIEFTPTVHCGFFRFTFPSGKPIVLLANRIGGHLTPEGANAFSGVEQFDGMQAFVYGEFNTSVDFHRSNDSGKTHLAILGSPGKKDFELRYGISFISVQQARKNLHEEIPAWDFDRIKQNARDRWNEVLGQIQVEGGTLDQRRVFYTSLYRCYERMVNISEDGQYYSGFDHQVHQDPRPFYVDCWIWDMYRALEPLQTLLNPEQEADKIQSYVRMYQQEGWMPSFAVLWGDYPCMTANHAAAWMADAWFKGVTNFDLDTAYQGLRKNSLEATLLPWRNGPLTSLDVFYNSHGWFPALRPGEKETVPQVNTNELRQSVSVTLDQSYDDWCTAQLARQIDNDDDYKLFLKRAAFYKNVFRADKGFVWPKDEDGNWIEPFDPKLPTGRGGRNYFTENNTYTFDWAVPQDFDELFQLMMGRGAAEEKLDELFRTDPGLPKYRFYDLYPDSSGMVGEFSMGNEPSLSIPYLFNHLGAPWKTQKHIRQLLDFWFTDTPLGMPGDEDGGAMSAFVVFSMMGFYPVVTGMPVYELGSTVFDRVTIRLHNGKTFRIICKKNSSDNKYIQSVKFNGRAQNQVWFRHSDVLKGLTIRLDMSDMPNTSLGIDPQDFPPSNITMDPRDFR